MTMAMGKPDWHPEPPRVPLPAACNCCSMFIILLCALIPILLVIPLTRSITMQPFVPTVAEPVGPPMPDTTLPPLGAVCTSGGYGAPVVPPGVRTMDSTWYSNELADGAQVRALDHSPYPPPHTASSIQLLALSSLCLMGRQELFADIHVWVHFRKRKQCCTVSIAPVPFLLSLWCCRSRSSRGWATCGGQQRQPTARPQPL